MVYVPEGVGLLEVAHPSPLSGAAIETNSLPQIKSNALLLLIVRDTRHLPGNEEKRFVAQQRSTRKAAAESKITYATPSLAWMCTPEMVTLHGLIVGRNLDGFLKATLYAQGKRKVILVGQHPLRACAKPR